MALSTLTAPTGASPALRASIAAVNSSVNSINANPAAQQTSTPSNTQAPSGASGASGGSGSTGNTSGQTYIGIDGKTYNEGGGGAVNTSGSSGSTTKPAPAVFSSGTANDFTNGVMLPAMNNGLSGMAAQNQQNSYTDLTHFMPGETAEAYNTRVASVNGSKGTGSAPGTTPNQSSTEDQAANTIANTPEAGNQFIYDANGSRVEVPLGTPLPSGYSSNAPANPLQRGHNVINQFNDESGITYQAYSDGTFGVAGMDGTFANGVSADQYNQALSNSPTQVLKSITEGLASLKNGTLPLTTPQQAQVDGLNNELASAVKSQQEANANYTGATTVAVNLYGMGNSISGMGIIKGTVDAGIAKVQDLQTKAATSIAQMEEQFNKDNLDQMYQYYQAYETAVKGIDDSINQMHTFAFNMKAHADQEADNLRTFNNTVQQQAITNKREDALASSTLATQALDRQKTELDIQSAEEANSYGANLPGGQVIGANGQVDPKLQTAYLANIAKTNPGLANTVQGIANYKVSMPASFLRSATGLKILSMVETYDPNFDQTQYQTRFNLQNNFASGQYSQQLTALNTASSHLATLAATTQKLSNVGFEPANSLKNFAGTITGFKPTSGAQVDIAALQGELASSFKKTGATDAEIKSLGTINQDSSPKAVADYISNAANLMAGKVSALNDTYTAGMGAQPTVPLLRNDAVTALSTLKNEGYDIQVPGVVYTNVQSYMKYGGGTTADLDAAKAQLQAAGLPITPDNILQAAQLGNQ